MSIDDEKFQHYFQKMKRENPRKLAEALAQLSPEEAEDILYDGKIWLRDNQRFDKYDESIILFCGGRGTGKDLSNSTPILTANRGWSTVGGVKIGDYVYTETGEHTRVIDKYVPPKRKLYKFTFSDRTSIVSSEEHDWVTWTHRDRKQFLRKKENGSFPPKDWPNYRGDIWHGVSKNPVGQYGAKKRTTREIIDTFHQTSVRGDLNHCIPLAMPLQNKPMDEIDFYYLGYWLGDGFSAAAHRLACGEEDVNHIETMWPDMKYGKGNMCAAPAGSRPFIYDLGLRNNKHFPQEFILASFGQRLDILQGLMDSDGHATNFNNVEFCNTNLSIAEGALQLARSLGQKPTLSEGRATLYGKDCGPKYRVTWRPAYGVNPFKLKRKADRIKFSGKQDSRNHHRMIVSYEEVEWEPTTCLSVDSDNHLFLAGEGLIPTHNTFSGAHWTKDLVQNKGVGRMALIGPSIADVRDTMVEGSSGIISVHKPREAPEYQPSKARVVWPNGATAKMYSSESPDSIRGGNNEAIWGDEISSWKYDDAFDQAMLTLRIGISQALFTTTPKPNKLIKGLFKRVGKDVRLITGSTYDNLDNLSKAFKEQVIASYEGTRLGKQELSGMLLVDVLGALWTTETIAECIVDVEDLPEFKKIIVVVDPSGSSKKTADECGLIVAALGVDDLVYILKDATAIMSPADWAAKSVSLMDAYNADYIVYEKNYGAEMIQAIYDAIRPNIPLKDIWAKKGKLIRAEGPSLLYEQHKVKHVRGLLDLEEEMTTYDGKGRSPNRLDAAVMAVQDLAMGKTNKITSSEFLL